MADVILTCPACGKQTPVSEYVSEKSVACQACGKELPVPARSRSSSGALKLRAPNTAAQTAPIPAAPDAGGGQLIPTAAVVQPFMMPAGRKRHLRRVKNNRVIQGLSWLLFIALAAALFFIRFRFGLSGAELETLKLAGLIVMGVAYLLIIALALQDNMFDGLLCIVVPLYPFYYLFLISGAIFLRAIVAGLLVGFGYDCFLFLQEAWLNVFNRVNYWIQHV